MIVIVVFISVLIFISVFIVVSVFIVLFLVTVASASLVGFRDVRRDTQKESDGQ
jgi:hypothetical protein